MPGGEHQRDVIRAYLEKRSILKKTYSPLSKLSWCALIIMSLTESGEAHSTTTVKNKHHDSISRDDTDSGGFIWALVVTFQFQI